jgi:hypothetical protein
VRQDRTDLFDDEAEMDEMGVYYDSPSKELSERICAFCVLLAGLMGLGLLLAAVVGWL